jgi:hypothetical protein
MWIRNKLPGMETVIINTDDIVSFDVVRDEEAKTHLLLVCISHAKSNEALKLAEGNFSEVNNILNNLLEVMGVTVYDIGL